MFLFLKNEWSAAFVIITLSDCMHKCLLSAELLTNLAVDVTLVVCTWSDWSTTILGGADKAEGAVDSAMHPRLVGAVSVS